MAAIAPSVAPKTFSNGKEAVEAFYFDRSKPAGVRLHLIRDEMLALR